MYVVVLLKVPNGVCVLLLRGFDGWVGDTLTRAASVPVVEGV